MVWEVESTTHFLEITNLGYELIHSINTIPYNPGSDLTEVKLELSNNDREVIIIPRVLENFMHEVNLDYPEETVNMLTASIIDRKYITCVAKFWTPKNSGEIKCSRYDFDNDELISLYFDKKSDFRLLIKSAPILDERLMPYFNELKELRPEIVRSLDNCVKDLMKPGTKYLKIFYGIDEKNAFELPMK